ncbi:hypothetical protein [Domibacillus mangrovi]|uniref:Abortive phage infection protein n=1 Tax=Domibacillus mangrovi TaxID=1714354 RepID=A0A1Q5P4U7_9BACI|nr:hypothetical protein [Domibacillus mangrovi]OKL37285.1 hypothetical protein BLL40_06835 [Domibacillus mangrovi]
MTIDEIENEIMSLRNGELKRIRIQKEDFLTFRSQLIKQPDFKQFRGTAQHGGHIDYEYTEIPRS